MSDEKESLQDLLLMAADAVRQVQEAQASLEKTLQRVRGEIDRALEGLARERALADAAIAGLSVNRDDPADGRAPLDEPKTGARAPIDRMEEMHKELEVLVGGLRSIVSEETPGKAPPAEASNPPELAAEPLHAESARPEPIRDV